MFSFGINIYYLVHVICAVIQSCKRCLTLENNRLYLHLKLGHLFAKPYCQVVWSMIAHVSEDIPGQGDKHPNYIWRQLVSIRTSLSYNVIVV